ncbi:MAG: diguanylate cyclase [Stenotrophomonas sp.]|nr:diguanylate cyclase [Stenotrophomonas sp.]
MRTLSKRLNLGSLILALALLSTVVALANTLLASYRVQRDQLVSSTLEANRVYANKLAETTQNFVLSSQQQLAYAAMLLGRNGMDDRRAQDEASRLQLQTNSFNSVLIVNQTGLVMATSPQTLYLKGDTLRSEGNRIALERRQPMISDPYDSATGKLLVAMSHPVFDAQGAYRGYVSGTIYLRQRSILQSLLGTHYYRDGSYLYVVDRNGRLLYHVDPERVGGYAPGNAVIDAVARGQRGAAQVNNSRGVSMLAGYAPVPATGWGIVAQRPTASTLQPLSQLMSSVIWRAIPLGVLSLLVTWWFARRISLPLWQLARNVQEGDTGRAISDVGGIRAWYFEVAQLKQAVLYSFNALQDRIGTLNRASRTDPLTGLLNRRGLQQALETWKAQGQSFAILALDIDRFKTINDQHGHAVGDQVIGHIAEQMRRYSRDGDVLCRNGGEEFLMLLPTTDADDALLIAERLRQQIATQPLDPVGHVSVSVGVAHFPTFDADAEQALRMADKALYMAKEQGRNRSVTYPYH